MPDPTSSGIVAGARTPMGRLLGSLKDLSGSDLGAIAIRGALAKAGVGPELVEYLIMGQVLTAGCRSGPGATGRGGGRDSDGSAGNREIITIWELILGGPGIEIGNVLGHRNRRRVHTWVLLSCLHVPIGAWGGGGISRLLCGLRPCVICRF